jgi:hypothetical protein
MRYTIKENKLLHRQLDGRYHAEFSGILYKHKILDSLLKQMYSQNISCLFLFNETYC